MRVISRKKLREFAAEYPDAETPLTAFFQTAERADWSMFAELRAVYSHADVVGKYTVINIGTNKYRMILEVFYESRVVLIRHVMTHKEYDRKLWAEDAHKPTPGPEDKPGSEDKPEPKRPRRRGR